MAILAVGLVIELMSAPVDAWMFSMTDEYEQRFRWFGRTGENDLFGNADVQEGVPGRRTCRIRRAEHVQYGSPPVLSCTDRQFSSESRKYYGTANAHHPMRLLILRVRCHNQRFTAYLVPYSQGKRSDSHSWGV
jgi:hypothetical protein